MPEITTRRVSINLYIATADNPDHVHLAVLAAVSDQWPIQASFVHGFDMNDPDEPSVQLVIDPVGGIRGAFVDNEERAEQLAFELGSVVVDLPITVDHRGEVNR